LALVKPVIFQIVGYKNSGKTTVMTNLIKRLKADGQNVVSIKHHGHGGKPETAKNNDSSKHLESGAIASIVEGEGSLLLQTEKAVQTIEEKIKLAAFFQPDVILIEGYKNESYPKLLLVRRKEDLELLQLRNIQVILVWDEALEESFDHVPWFYINDPSAINWTADYLENQL
jgi:molybdopterin-guanine dinucleotide biosynthesis protein B